MRDLVAVLQVLLSVGVPAVVLWLENRSRIIKFLSPVIVCYGVGMLFGNQPWLQFDEQLALSTCDITVALAIPLLLFSVSIVAWLKLAKNTVISFFFCMLSVMVMAALAHSLFTSGLDDTAKVAGMLVGVYTGGTPNMAAIGTALKIESETFILLNAADIMISFIYLFFILVIARRLLVPLVPATERLSDGEEEDAEEEKRIPSPRVVAYSLLLTAVIVAAGLSVRELCPPSCNDAVAILVITTLGVVASLHPSVRAMRGTHDMGQFLLLVFCVAMGFTTDFGKLFSATPTILLFVAFVLCGSVVLHFVLSILFRIDRDTIIITSAAAIFGPHMVGPVAVNLKNREILFSGLASGLVGYAVGNYLGLGLAWILS